LYISFYHIEFVLFVLDEFPIFMEKAEFMLTNHKTPRKKIGFRAARQNRIFQDIVEQIQEAILGSRYQPGDVLPPERELRETFQTSRGTLREALRVLEQKGLIEIRLGVNGGAFVKGSISEPMAESLSLMLRYRKISLLHLNEFREDVEGIVTARAAERAEESDIQKLDDLLAQAAKIMPQGKERWLEFLEIDKQFHREIARISRNPIYIFMHNVIHSNIQSYYDEYLPPNEEILRENFKDLSDILKAIQKKKANQACALVQSHVRRFYDHMVAHNQYTS
jgi:DNA-binding FadR family transcriptional regulator